MAYSRTAPSTHQSAREKIQKQSMAPREILEKTNQEKGAIVGARTSAELLRDTKQDVRFSNKNGWWNKSVELCGWPKPSDYKAVLKWSLEGHFVKALQVSHQFGVDRDAMPHILCAKNWQANMICTFACYKPTQGAGALPNAILLRPLYIDMMYDLSECFVTVFVI